MGIGEPMLLVLWCDLHAHIIPKIVCQNCFESNPTAMSDRGEQYRCHYCGFKTKSSSGLTSHISQSPACLDKILTTSQLSSRSQK